jgi:hypothetical protein
MGEGRIMQKTLVVREGQTHKVNFLDEDDLDEPS